MTIPRELKLVKRDTGYYVTASPVKELAALKSAPVVLHNLAVKGDMDLGKLVKRSDSQYELKVSSKQLKSFSITFSNGAGEQLAVGYDEAENNWYIDRTRAGISDFYKDFAKRIIAKRVINNKSADITLVVDAASIELFADKGLTVMSATFFPNRPYNKVIISSAENFTANNITCTSLKSIWH
jgi:fructan beta-fructosidase